MPGTPDPVRRGGGVRLWALRAVERAGDFSNRDAHYMLRSYDTDNICIKNAAFSCDNALAAVTAWFAMAVNGFNPYAFGQW